MKLHDYLNVRRVLRALATEWKCPVWIVKIIIRGTIQRSWENAMSDHEAKVLWETYFPSGKPSPEQYILRLGHAHETGTEIPVLLQK